ncbi:MAG TPA: response regulator [Candidatus Angelobacter sp.]|nr:response regulator [Candidatus Angelobacter sp.]
MAPAYKQIFIVVIDDNQKGLEFLYTALTRPGVEVLAASTPEDGLALVDLYKPQIVMTDLVMPGMDGLEVLRKVRQMNPAIDVIVTSAEESGGSRTDAIKQGAADYLTKPTPLSVLRECVGKLIQKHVSE